MQDQTPSPENAGIGRSGKIAIGVLAGVAVLCLLLPAIMLIGWRPSSAKSARQSKPGPYAHLAGTTAGAPDAKLKVLALVPLDTDCHTPSVTYLQTAARAHPDRFFVQFVNRRDAHGEAELKRLKLSCASIVVNGMTRFALPDGRNVKLEGGPNESFDLIDLHDVLQAQADHLYGAGSVVMPSTDEATRTAAPAATGQPRKGEPYERR